MTLTQTILLALAVTFAIDAIACTVYLVKTGRIKFKIPSFKTAPCSGSCNQGRDECDCNNV